MSALSEMLRDWKIRSSRKGYGISILIPFRGHGAPHRVKNLVWLTQYWLMQLPGAQVIIGEDPHCERPFSKAVAVNNAVRLADPGSDIFVIADADGYIDADRVLHCAHEIRKARRRDQRLWFVPYRKFYRLNEHASKLLLESQPQTPFAFTDPPKPEFIQGDADPSVGHWYGAMMQIMPREAFEIVGGWDPRFRGWGGEDHAAMRAMDTLYWPHKTLASHVLHVWHPQIGPSGTDDWVHWKERMWAGQTDPAVNDKLSWRYYHATGKHSVMRKLLNEGLGGDRPTVPFPCFIHHRLSQ